MRVMDGVCITIFEGDVVFFPLEMFYRSLVQIVDINEWPIPCFPDVAVLGPMHFLSEVRFAEDSLDLEWGLHCRSIILRSRPPIIHIILQVLMLDKLLYLIFQGDTLLGRVSMSL